MSSEFFSELDYSSDTIEAALAEGIVEKWRCDGAGVQWFRSTGRPMIRAVPGADDGFAAPSGFLDGDDDGGLEHDHGDDAGGDAENDGVFGDDSNDES